MRRIQVAMVVAVLAAAGCNSTFDTNRTVDPYSSFGAIVYREGCQRVAYTGQLAQKAAGQIQTVDVSGSLGHAVCVDGMPPPANAPPMLPAIVKEKDELTATVDAILPKDFLDTLENFLEQILPLSDDGTMETAISSLGNLLGTMQNDPDFAPALARLATRVGYRPTKTAAGLVHTVIEYPNVDDFLGKLLALIAPGGSAEPEWTTLLTAMSHELKNAEPVVNPADPNRTLKLALNLVLATHPDLGDGTVRPLVARDYRGMATATTVNGKVQPPFVDMDGDGLADTDGNGHFVDATGQILTVPTPFPDTGVTDTAPRDANGRALTAAGGTPIYKYLDLDGTVMGGLTRETLTLMDPTKDTTLGLVYGMSALLGPRASQTKMYMGPMGGMQDSLTYSGYDTTQSAVLDLMHAFIQILGDPNADQTLQTTSTLLSSHESETSRLIGAMLNVSDLGKMHPEAQIPATSDLYDDLMPFVVRILRVPGLAEDIVAALENPAMKDFAPMVARLMTARNQIDFDHTKNSQYLLIGGPGALDTIDPVDRTMPDVDYNRSLMQRIAHLIHDSDGVQFCNQDGANPSVPLSGGPYAACKMFRVPDLGLFYVLNMASAAARNANPSAKAGADFCSQLTTTNAILTGGCSSLIGQLIPIPGFGEFPSPSSLNRALFLTDAEKPSSSAPLGIGGNFLADTSDDILCKDGDKFIDVHDKSIFAWETTMPNPPSGNPNATFYTAVQPLVDAFARHDECLATDPQTGNCTKTQNAAKIFVDLFAMLHEHWGSPQSSYFGHTYQSTDPNAPRFAYPDNVVSYEPLVAQVLGQSDLVPATLALAPVLTSVTVDGTAGGQPALPVLIGTARYLFDPAAAAADGIAYRNGMVSTTFSDGVTPVPQATPYYLLADAYAHKRAALAAAPMAQQGSWKSATSNMVDQMLTVVQPTPGVYQLQNRRMHAITLVLIDFLRQRLAAHAQAGDLQQWVHHDLTQDLTDTLGGPTFAALGDFVAKVEQDPDARTQLYNLLQYLVDESDHDLVFQTALTTLTDQVQTFMDDPDLVPVAHILGDALDPAAGTVQAQLTLIKKARDLDSNHALLTVLRNLYQLNAQSVYPASDLSDVISEIDRTNPGQGGALDAGDYRSILGEVHDFLLDDKRGFTRFLNIVKSRGPH